MSTDKRPKIVVLGTGFAAFSLVKRIDTDLYDVVVVSPRNHFLFTPLLPGTTVGTVEFRSIIEPIRTARTDIRYYQARCVKVDRTKNVITCRDPFENHSFEVDYDYLVIAVGAVTNTYGVPGVLEHALFLKELSDAREIRQATIECFEKAARPDLSEEERKEILHFVVVGGGPTGVEFAAELHDFITEDIAKWYPDLRGLASVSILEAAGAILTQFDKELAQYALRHLQRTGVNVRTGAMVAEVREDSVQLKNGDSVPCRLVVWSTGIGPTRLVQDLDLPKDEFSRLRTNAYFLVNTTENIYAIGDCSNVESKNLPPTAQTAQQEGFYLARVFNRRANNKDVKPFEYEHMGMLAYIGQKRALADLEHIKGRGRSAWLLWRSAYLTKLVSWKNKILVLIDWMKTFIFGRDISRF